MGSPGRTAPHQPHSLLGWVEGESRDVIQCLSPGLQHGFGSVPHNLQIAERGADERMG